NTLIQPSAAGKTRWAHTSAATEMLFLTRRKRLHLQELVEATSLHTNFGSFRFAFIAVIKNRRCWEASPLGQRSHRFIKILVLNFSTGKRNETICYDRNLGETIDVSNKVIQNCRDNYVCGYGCPPSTVY